MSFTSLEEGFKGRVFLLLSLDLQYAKWYKIFDFDCFLKMSLWCFTGVIFLSLENFGGDVPGSVVGYVNVHTPILLFYIGTVYPLVYLETPY